MQIPVITQTFARTTCCLALLVAFLAGYARAQSTDIALPSAVQTNEITGTIAARDLGDARLTDHFYAFIGTPGDLVISVDARNMNGDIDVFSSTGLRPLLKITVYAENTSPVTKSIYLRTREDLILRVEGRTPNDDDGIYRLRFGGSFEPITSGPLLARAENPRDQPSTPDDTSARTTGKRVTSVGARIEEPAPPPSEAAVAPAPEPTPAESRADRTTTPRANSGRRAANRRTRPVQPPKPAENATKSEEETKPATDETPRSERRPAARRSSTRRSPTARAAPKPPPAEAAPESGPRLLIETSYGTLIDRYMSSVRRVTVENGQVVVVGKDGKIQRIALIDVVRMTISP